MRLYALAILSLFAAAPAAAEDFGRFTQIGMASWYGGSTQSGRTADGERLDMDSISAAHKTLPLPCYARVTNLRNHKSIVVRVNDRGPFIRGRVIDLSARAASLLDFRSAGMARVKIDYMGRAPAAGTDAKMLLASLRNGAEPAPPETTLAYSAPIASKLTDAPALTALAAAFHAANQEIRDEPAPMTVSPFGDLSQSPFIEVVAKN